MHRNDGNDADDVVLVGERSSVARLRRNYIFKETSLEPNSNSLFHCFAQHEGKPLEYALIRERICDYIEQNSSRYEADMMMSAQSLQFNCCDYIHRMRRHTTSGTLIEVRAYSDMYETTIVVWCNRHTFEKVYGVHHKHVCHLRLLGSQFQLLSESLKGTFYGTANTHKHFSSVPTTSTFKRVRDTASIPPPKMQRTNALDKHILTQNFHADCDDDIIEIGEGTYGAQLRRKYTFQVLPTDADGNCLFHSFAIHEGNPRDFNRIRNEVCDYIECHVDRYLSDIQNTARLHHSNTCEYIERMRTPTTWGTNIEVRAYSDRNSTAVVIWRNPQRFTSVYGANNDRVCHLFLQGNHFQLLVESPQGSTFGTGYNHTLHSPCKQDEHVMAKALTNSPEVHVQVCKLHALQVPHLHPVSTLETPKVVGIHMGDNTGPPNIDNQMHIVHYVQDNKVADHHQIIHAGKIFSVGSKEWFDYVRGSGDIQKASELFMKECEDVPVHPCGVCNTLQFGRNVKKAATRVLAKAISLGLTILPTSDVCGSCQRSILSSKSPKFS